MVIARLVVKGARLLLYFVSKDILQSCHALLRALGQQVFIDGDMVDNNLKFAVLPLAAAWLRLHPDLPSYGVRLKSSR